MIWRTSLEIYLKGPRCFVRCQTNVKGERRLGFFFKHKDPANPAPLPCRYPDDDSAAIRRAAEDCLTHIGAMRRFALSKSRYKFPLPFFLKGRQQIGGGDNFINFKNLWWEIQGRPFKSVSEMQRLFRFMLLAADFIEQKPLDMALVKLMKSSLVKRLQDVTYPEET